MKAITARQIRERYAAGGISQAAVAREFGTTQRTVCAIVRGNRHAQAGGPLSLRQKTSRYYGVHWDRNARRWEVCLRTGARTVYGGQFTDETDAAHGADRLALMLHGDHARLNFPPQLPE